MYNTYWILNTLYKRKNIRHLILFFILIICGSDNILDILVSVEYIVRLISRVFFHFLKNTATRKLKITSVVCIVFLLDRAVLE